MRQNAKIKIVYKYLADDFIKQVSTLHHNIVKALMNTKGNVTYRQIENHIGGLVTEKDSSLTSETIG